MFNSYDFGQRAWGAICVLWIIGYFIDVPIWYNVLSSLLILYFLWFGTERFKK